MASLWNLLRQEVRSTIDDFREKGAVGALRDAVLDTRDIAADASGWLVNEVKELVAVNDSTGEDRPFLRCDRVPSSGEVVMLEYPDGQTAEATVAGTDEISSPPRASVHVTGTDEPIIVDLVSLEYGPQTLASASPRQEQHDSTRVAGDAERVSLLEGFRQEWHNTVQDLREKGAVGAVKDAAFDAADLVSSTATSAINGAQSLVVSSSAGSSDRAVAVDGDMEEDAGLFGGLKQRGHNTLQEFREKGAVGAVKDAALDVVDITRSTAATALSGARSLVLVDAQDEAEANADEDAEATTSGGGNENSSLLDNLKQEWCDAVQELRDKGALGTLKGAALDAKNVVGSTAVSAYNAAKPALSNARSFAEPALSNARSLAEPAISGARTLAEPALAGAWTMAEPAISCARTFAAGTDATQELVESSVGSSVDQSEAEGPVFEGRMSSTLAPLPTSESESVSYRKTIARDESHKYPESGPAAMRRSAFERPKEAEELID